MGGISTVMYRLVVPAHHTENVQNLGAYKNICGHLKFTDFQSIYLLTGVLSKSGVNTNAHHHCPISVFILTTSELELEAK